MEWSVVTTAVTNLLGIVGTVVTTIAENPLLALFLAVPVVGAGCTIFGRFLHTAQ